MNVDPKAKTVAVHRPGAESVTFSEDQKVEGSKVLPEFACAVVAFFA